MMPSTRYDERLYPPCPHVKGQDRFKAVSDALGHAAADGVLRITSGIRRLLLQSDTVIRIGGGEFTAARERFAVQVQRSRIPSELAAY